MSNQSGDMAASGTMISSANIELNVVANFAWQHMKSATLLRDQVKQVEAKNHGEPFGAFFEELRAYCSSCVLASVASLEALINELYLDPNRPLQQGIRNFNDEFWGKKGEGKKGIEAFSIVDKYKDALKRLSCEQLANNAEYQDVLSLIGLRNLFVHYKPRRGNGGPDASDLERRLKGRFDLSPFSGGSSDFYTHQCMSAGCAEWAVSTALWLIGEFATKAPNLDAIKLAHFQQFAKGT